MNSSKRLKHDKLCAILCSYRTSEYEDFKDLSGKLELFEDCLVQNKSNLFAD